MVVSYSYNYMLNHDGQLQLQLHVEPRWSVTVTVTFKRSQLSYIYNKAFVDIRLRPSLTTPRRELYFATLILF